MLRACQCAGALNLHARPAPWPAASELALGTAGSELVAAQYEVGYGTPLLSCRR